MRDIIITYPVKDVALKLRALLESEGFHVSYVCALGSSTLSIAQELNEGIVIAASNLSDMTASNIAEHLPPGFDVIALCKNGKAEYMGNLINMPMPVQREDFLQTVAVLVSTRSSFNKRGKNETDIISDAKLIIMSKKNISEGQAHRYLQNESMRQGKKMIDLARDIIDSFTD